jgi:hypothetical protein
VIFVFMKVPEVMSLGNVLDTADANPAVTEAIKKTIDLGGLKLDIDAKGIELVEVDYPKLREGIRIR